MILNYVTPELELRYISPDGAPNNDSGAPYRPLQRHGSQDTRWNRCGYISNRHLRPKTPPLRVPPSSKSVSIRVHPWFSSASSPTVSHFSLITDHSAHPPTLTRTYDWGIRYRDDLIRRINHLDGEEIHYALHDYYNVTAITVAAGTVLERYGYSAFGDVRFMTAAYATKANSDHTWDLLYKAQFLDIETGFYNYGYRYLSPILGRWLSRDPIAEEGGFNLYAFVTNNGVNGTDFLGCGELWTISGITNHTGTDFEDYVGEEMIKRGLKPTNGRRYRSELGIGKWYRENGGDVFHPDSERMLDQEAEGYGNGCNDNGCGKKIWRC